MQMNLSSRQLRAFLALAEQRNFTRAAALTHLSQPAFSALIRSLEDALELRLFDRSTRHVELTVEGKEFEVSARRILAEVDAALTDAREYAGRQRGRVAIALLPSLAAGWLPTVLAEFHAANPGIDLDVADVLSEDCIARVRGGKADFAIAAIRADTPELRAELFCSDLFHLVCPTGHPLAKEGTLRPRELAACPFIHLSRTSSVRQFLDAAIHPLQMKTFIEVDQLATVTGMVRAGLGISVVPSLTLFTSGKPASSRGRCCGRGSRGASTWCAVATAGCRSPRRACTRRSSAASRGPRPTLPGAGVRRAERCEGKLDY